jgi:DNA-binding NtrC family response regulator
VSSAGPRPTVLFVDDEEALLHAIVRTLRKEPFNVLTTTSPAQALRMLADRPVDVIVSDEHMPGMSGSELLRRVRTQHPSTVRVLLTGGAGLDTNMRAIQDGEVYRFLTKPVPSEELARTIVQAFNMAQLLRQRHSVVPRQW